MPWFAKYLTNMPRYSERREKKKTCNHKCQMKNTLKPITQNKGFEKVELKASIGVCNHFNIQQLKATVEAAKS